MSTPQIVCILGMHRSGTSLITRILNLLGVYLGQDRHLASAGADNPKGFWEHLFFYDINETILHMSGGTWQSPPPFVPGWENRPELLPLRDKTRLFVAQEFAGAGLWGWKDPRTCLTLPFWQSLLGDMCYVVCLRNPLDVALSLQHRDKMSPAEGSRLWLSYQNAVWQHTQNRPCCFVFYEDVMRDWPSEAARLASFIGRPEACAQEQVRRAIAETVSAELYHHATPLGDTLHQANVTFAAKAMFLLLRMRHGGQEMQSQEWMQLMATVSRYAMQSSNGDTESFTGQLHRQTLQLIENQGEIKRLHNQLQAMESSLGWRLLQIGRKLRGFVLPFSLYLRMKDKLAALKRKLL
jgi:hypothetical protein